MKRLRIISLLIVLLLTFSLILTGCSPKTEEEDVSVNTKEGQQNTHEETDIEKAEVKGEQEQQEAAEEEEEQEESEEADVEKEIVEEPEEEPKKEPKKEPKEVRQQPEEIAEQLESEEDVITLKIEGEIANELSLSLDELKAMENLIFEGDFYSLNSFGTTEHTNFKGINLWRLLKDKAQISQDATKVTIVATDGYSMEFAVEQVKKQDYIDETNPDAKFPMIIAWGENGEEYDSEEGPPFKLVVGQKEPGDVNKPQWVSNIDKIVVE